MKDSFISRCIVLMSVVGLLAGCASENQQLNTTTMDIKYDFINMCFTTDYNSRYTSYGDIEDIDEMAEKYYAQIAELTTQECLDSMIASRIPFSWDKHAIENDRKVSVKETSFEVYDEENNVYTFSVTVEIDDKEKIEQNVVKGQISVSEVEGEEKISNLYVAK